MTKKTTGIVSVSEIFKRFPTAYKQVEELRRFVYPDSKVTAAIIYPVQHWSGFSLVLDNGGKAMVGWNPLYFYDQTFSIAVKLGITVLFDDEKSAVAVSHSEIDSKDTEPKWIEYEAGNEEEKLYTVSSLIVTKAIAVYHKLFS